MTPPHLASRLMEFLSGSGESWLELGSGTGRIAEACLASRGPSEYLGIEVDSRLMRKSPECDGASFLLSDVLSPTGLSGVLGQQMFSRTVGNPPYGMQAMSKACQLRVAELCPGIPQIMDWVQLDLYFVLESLARLKRPGEAAFIVGAPVAEDSRLVAFRRALLSSASEVECFELPSDIFDKKAEVQSYILVARFGASRLSNVRLGRISGSNLAVTDERVVSVEEATHRLDFGFYEFRSLSDSLQRRAGCKTLADLNATIIRGSRTRSQFEDLGIECFHTSDFPPGQDLVRFDMDKNHGFQFAVTDDILLPRVGTRCLDRQALVAKGQRHFTEAVYRLRVPKRHHSQVVDWVLSDLGTRWRQAAATGSCAKHLTVATLMAMPVPAAI